MCRCFCSKLCTNTVLMFKSFPAIQTSVSTKAVQLRQCGVHAHCEKNHPHTALWTSQNKSIITLQQIWSQIQQSYCELLELTLRPDCKWWTCDDLLAISTALFQYIKTCILNLTTPDLSEPTRQFCRTVIDGEQLKYIYPFMVIAKN